MRSLNSGLANQVVGFQSTHSVTECDWFDDGVVVDPKHFNPRTPLQSAIKEIGAQDFGKGISIHALRYRVRFEYGVVGDDDKVKISIHALRYRVR